ncbi:hypothetical protein [Ornithobacterium rhinotracheale]
MKKIFFSIILFSGIFALGQTNGDPFKCPKFYFSAKNLYTKSYLDLNMKIMEKDITLSSLYFDFDKVIKLIENTLNYNQIPSKEQSQIIGEIQNLKDNLSLDELKSLNKNTEKDKFPNIIAFSKSGYLSSLNINPILEKYLPEEKAKKVEEDFTINHINAKNAESFLEEQFCVYREKNIIDKKYDNHSDFMVDYFKKLN